MAVMTVVMMVGAKKAFYVSISSSEVPRQLCRQEEQQVCEQVSLSWWLVEKLVSWLVDQLVSCLINWLVGCWVSWPFGLFLGSLVARFGLGWVDLRHVPCRSREGVRIWIWIAHYLNVIWLVFEYCIILSLLITLRCQGEVARRASSGDLTSSQGGNQSLRALEQTEQLGKHCNPIF